MFLASAFAWSLTLLCLPSSVLSNTEIINFDVLQVENVELPPSLTQGWPILTPRENEREFTLEPAPSSSTWDELCNANRNREQDASNGVIAGKCSHELWAILDTSAELWKGYSKFTLRLSWPAFFPADFKLEIFSPADVASHFDLPSSSGQNISSDTTTRTYYARVRIINTGVLTPQPPHNLPMPPFVARQDPSTFPRPVPFMLIAEPLYLGVLPPTVVPVLGYIGLTVLVAYFLTPKILKVLEDLARNAREEFAAKDQKTE